jgi:hypothetical protein
MNSNTVCKKISRYLGTGAKWKTITVFTLEYVLSRYIIRYIEKQDSLPLF